MNPITAQFRKACQEFHGARKDHYRNNGKFIAARGARLDVYKRLEERHSNDALMRHAHDVKAILNRIETDAYEQALGEKGGRAMRNRMFDAWREMKDRYPGYIVLVRHFEGGDWLETYAEDAETTSEIFDRTLDSAPINEDGDRAWLVRFPFWDHNWVVKKFLANGYGVKELCVHHASTHRPDVTETVIAESESVEEFVETYYRYDRYRGRGKEYADAVMASAKESFEEYGYDLITHHSSTLGQDIWYYGPVQKKEKRNHVRE